jgi:predicted MFS family arabinose efflux permease
MPVAAALTIFAAILQAASQNIAMFVISRILIGIGTCSSGIAGMIHGHLEKYHD